MPEIGELISTGALAAATGRATSTIKYFAERGVISPGFRVVGSNRRVWPASQLEEIKRQLAEHERTRTRVA